MNLSAIQAFVLISELGSISAAAKKMKNNRVLVSLWISALEDEWNVQLLDRSGQKPTITAAGKNFLPHPKEGNFFI